MGKGQTAALAAVLSVIIAVAVNVATENSYSVLPWVLVVVLAVVNAGIAVNTATPQGPPAGNDSSTDAGSPVSKILKIFTISSPYVAILGATALFVVHLTSPKVELAVSFSSPAVDEVLTDKGLRVKGTVTGLESGEGLWLVTLQYPREQGDNYQPQDKPCVLSADNAFDCDRVYAGVNGDPDTKYDVVIVRVTADAVREFVRYDETNPKERGYPGLAELPKGADPIGRIRIFRKHVE